MDVSKNSGTPKSPTSHRVFPYKPSILGYPTLFLETPNITWQSYKCTFVFCTPDSDKHRRATSQGHLAKDQPKLQLLPMHQTVSFEGAAWNAHKPLGVLCHVLPNYQMERFQKPLGYSPAGRYLIGWQAIFNKDMKDCLDLWPRQDSLVFSRFFPSPFFGPFVCGEVGVYHHPKGTTI